MYIPWNRLFFHRQYVLEMASKLSEIRLFRYPYLIKERRLPEREPESPRHEAGRDEE
jgi:hypothetical protein